MANPIRISYKVRWGHERTRTLKGNPQRLRRQIRADERAEAYALLPLSQRRPRTSPRPAR